MNRTIPFVAFVIFAALASGVMGCSPLRISMNPTATMEPAARHIPCTIILFLDNDFRHYRWEGFSKAELRGLSYDLGSASMNLFVRAFTQAADHVAVVTGRPEFPLSAGGDIVLVVYPRIGAFSEEHHAFIRNADYVAEITYRVTIYDKTGRIVLENDYRARAAQMGDADVYRNFAAPAEKAMAKAALRIIDDIGKLQPLRNPDDQAR